jgi:predicted phage terminase large subunit-like protein
MPSIPASNKKILIPQHARHSVDIRELFVNAAHVMREDDWNIVALELVAERDRTYNMGAVNYHRKKGELLRPGLFSEEQIRSLRETVRIPEFQLFYQQGCGSSSALKLDRSDFPLFEAGTVSLLPIVISIDTAQKMSGSSRHAVQVWRTDGRDHYLIEAYSSASHYSDLRRGLARLTRKYPPSMILIEDASSGSMLVAELQVEGVTNVLPIIARGSKAERLAPHMATLKKRRVHLLHGAAWLGDWVSEILAFPSGRDDQVDALTQFLAYMANNPELNRCVPRERGMMAAALGSHGVRPATMQGSVLVTGSSFLRPPAPEHTSPPGPTLPVAQDPIPIVCGTADGAHIWWLKATGGGGAPAVAVGN